MRESGYGGKWGDKEIEFESNLIAQRFFLLFFSFAVMGRNKGPFCARHVIRLLKRRASLLLPQTQAHNIAC